MLETITEFQMSFDVKLNKFDRCIYGTLIINLTEARVARLTTTKGKSF